MKIKQITNKFNKRRKPHHGKTLKRKKSENNLKILTVLGTVLFAVLLSLFVLIGVLLVRFESERYKQQEIENVQQIMDVTKASLKNRIYSNIYKVSAVKALVAMNPDLTQDDFARAMEIQFRGEHDLRNIGLARDMILQFMYPIEGNEAAVGLDYTTLPDQFEAVDLALRLNEIVLAGPLTLVQGGEGIVARIPIYIKDTASYQEEFWGFASVVMKSETLFAGAGIKEDHDVLRIAIRGRDALGAKGDIFWGDPRVFEENPVTQLIELPYGSWQIGAIPSAGWSSYSALSSPLMWAYLLAAFTILTFTAFIIFLLTGQKRVVGELEKEQNLFAAGPVFNMEWEPEPYGSGIVTYVSSNVEQILGYSPAEMLHSQFSYNDIIHPDDLKRVITELQHNIANHIHTYETSYRLKTKPGQYLWIYDFTRLVRNEDGTLTGIRSYLYDQTAQKKVEEALRIAEERLEKTAYELTENIPVGTYTMVQPPEGGMANFAFMSSRFLELTGLTREEATADPLKAFACGHPDDYDEWVALNVRAFEEISPFFGEARVIVDGEVRWVTAESSPRTLPDGTTVWEGVLTDITDRKRVEEALSESLSRFNDLVAHVSVGVYVFWIRAAGSVEFEYVSDGWCKMNQIRRGDVLANPMLAFDIIHPAELANFQSLNQEAVRERKRFSWEGRMLIGGDVSFALIESTPVFFDNGDSRWFGIQQDITQRKNNQEKLKIKTQQLREAYERINQDLEKAWRLHQQFLPAAFPESKEYSFAAYYQPAENLGGDFYNVVEVGDELIIYLADVSGHGLDGSMLSIFVRENISSYLFSRHDQKKPVSPQAVLKFLLDRYSIEDFPADYFICMLIGVLDKNTGRFVYSNAGFHVLPVGINSQGRLFALEGAGFPISTVIDREQIHYQNEEYQIEPGSLLLFTTDGLIEEIVGENMYGEKPLKNIFTDFEPIIIGTFLCT